MKDYRKIFNIDTLPNKGKKIVKTNLNFNDNCILQKIFGKIENSNGIKLSIPCNDILFELNNINGELTITTLNDYSNFTGSIIIDYRK